MKTENNINLRDKITVLIILFLLGSLLTFFYIKNSDTSFSIWSYSHPASSISNVNYDLFRKGETFKGEFVAKDNNLGIVSIRFQTYIRPPYKDEDHLLFKFKEKGSSEWYYTNVYRTGLVYDIPFFPFGFPQIADSKGKNYEFQITPLNTDKTNQISISKRYPILQTKYKYSGHELLRNPNELRKFLIIKFTNAFKTPDLIFATFIYFLPFIFYLIWFMVSWKMNFIVRKGKVYYGKSKTYPFGALVDLDNFLFLLMLLDIFILQIKDDAAYLIILVLWVMCADICGYKSKRSFIFALILIALCPLLLLFKAQPTAEKSAAWAFVILSAGLIQLFIEQRKNSINS
jgi:hypothetical protein